MKKLLILFIAFFALTAAAQAKENNDTTAVFTVTPPLTCTNCEKTVVENLRFEKGVKKVVASHKDNTVTVTFDKRKTTWQKIADSFGKIGRKAKTIGKEGCTEGEKPCAAPCSGQCCGGR